MRYLLKSSLQLRGWAKLPYALVNRESKQVEFVPADVFQVLDLANGKIDFDSVLISDAMREMAGKIAENGAIAPCDGDETLLPDQAYIKYPARYIESAHWSITGRCNYKCKHCYMSAPSAKFGELTHEACMDIIEQLAACGVMKVSLTGGEPLVRDDFLELVDAILSKGIRITTIYSNGKLVTDALLDALLERGIRPEFNMSFDGVGYHDWLRGIEGAEKIVEDAFRLCREKGFPTGAEMCIHTLNHHTLRESINRLAELGCRSLKTNPVSSVGEWVLQEEDFSIAMDDLFEVYLEYIPHFYEDGMPINLMLGGFFMADKGKETYYIPSMKHCKEPKTVCVCGHARHHMYLSAEGRALPCMALSGMEVQKEFPLVTEIGIEKCLSDSRYMELINTRADALFEHNPECQTCEHALQCLMGCRASALETSKTDILAPDKATCKIFKGGYIPRIKETVSKANPMAKLYGEEGK